MMRHIRLFMVVLITAVLGCSESQPSPKTEQAVVPSAIQIGNTTWKYIPVQTAADQKLLDIYLRENASLIDSLTGKTVALYEANQTKRFYFLISVSGVIEWIYLEFSQGKFRAMDQGTGTPF